MAEQQLRELTIIQPITTFNNLSSELILCIFEYLSVVDRYESFFDCNTRLRQLVKRWTSYSRTDLQADIARYSTLHSWYKHLTFDNGGSEFFIIPQKGQQLRYSFDPCVTDTTNLHWHFLYITGLSIVHDERVRQILARCSFRLNPFFYHQRMGTRSKSTSHGQNFHDCTFYGGDIITGRRFKTFQPWIKSNYPEYADQILNTASSSHGDIDQQCAPIFEAEWIKATRTIREAAHRVWEELKQLEDVNPFEIKRDD